MRAQPMRFRDPRVKDWGVDMRITPAPLGRSITITASCPCLNGEKICAKTILPFGEDAELTIASFMVALEHEAIHHVTAE